MWEYMKAKAYIWVLKQQTKPNVDTDLTVLFYKSFWEQPKQKPQNGNISLRKTIIRRDTEESVAILRESVLITIQTFLQNTLWSHSKGPLQCLYPPNY